MACIAHHPLSHSYRSADTSRCVPVWLSQTCVASLRQFACDAYPEECCGLILGRTGHHAHFGVRAHNMTDCDQRAYPVANSAPWNARRSHFCIAPQAWLAAEVEALAAGLHIVGIYHSHPDRPALLSAIDRVGAPKNAGNVIVSCVRGIYTQVRSWHWCALCDDFVMDRQVDPYDV